MTCNCTFIDDTFLKKIKCTRCGSLGTFEEKRNGLSDYTFRCHVCGNNYNYKDGILDTLNKFDGTYWDNLYTAGLKGNSVHGSKLIRLVEKTLNNLPNSLLYFSLVDLLWHRKTNFKISIELGCGTGVYSLLLKKMRIVETPILVDMSLPALKIAQNVFDAFGVKALFVLADATNLPFGDNCLDISLSGGLIEHFNGERLTKIVSEHCRAVSTVACQFPAPTPAYWLQRNCISLINFGWPFGYELPLPKKTVRGLFEAERFHLSAGVISRHD